MQPAAPAKDLARAPVPAAAFPAEDLLDDLSLELSLVSGDITPRTSGHLFKETPDRPAAAASVASNDDGSIFTLDTGSLVD